MKRFLEIKAADIQVTGYNDYDDNGNLIQSYKGLVPVEENQVKSNKFLVRIISRSSGKKMDILVNFFEQ